MHALTFTNAAHAAYPMNTPSPRMRRVVLIVKQKSPPPPIVESNARTHARTRTHSRVIYYLKDLPSHTSDFVCFLLLSSRALKLDKKSDFPVGFVGLLAPTLLRRVKDMDRQRPRQMERYIIYMYFNVSFLERCRIRGVGICFFCWVSTDCNVFVPVSIRLHSPMYYFKGWYCIWEKTRQPCWYRLPPYHLR